VARLAGIPKGVIERAREVLKLHERSERRVTETLAPRPERPVQIRLFEPVGHDIAARIRELKLDELRPIDALKVLSDLQDELNASCE
jgi:DNA mismatch repair protein MutS